MSTVSRRGGVVASVVIATVLVALSACGGSGGSEPPRISDLKLAAKTVTVGAQSTGTLTVADPDGLGGLKLRLAFTGPASPTVEVSVQGASDALKVAQLPFVFGLVAGSPPGQYTLSVSAIDGDGNESNALSDTFTAQ